MTGIVNDGCIFRMATLTFVLSCAAWSGNVFAQQPMNNEITVLAAGSLREVMRELGDVFQMQTRQMLTSCTVRTRPTPKQA
jgi:ABC-type molybdate transport system substrate-binding protein